MLGLCPWITCPSEQSTRSINEGKAHKAAPAPLQGQHTAITEAANILQRLGQRSLAQRFIAFSIPRRHLLARLHLQKRNRLRTASGTCVLTELQSNWQDWRGKRWMSWSVDSSTEQAARVRERVKSWQSQTALLLHRTGFTHTCAWIRATSWHLLIMPNDI